MKPKMEELPRYVRRHADSVVQVKPKTRRDRRHKARALRALREKGLA